VAPAARELPPAVRAALPTFFIVGAAKAGTTSLHEYLAAHPEISMSEPKEPMCFQPRHWLDRLPEYQRLFATKAAVRGESSTAYTAFPWAPDVPDRVRETVPHARIIYIVRDPIPRLISHHAQNVWDGLARRPFDELMDDLEDQMNMPVWSSRYATQLERWSERFPANQILVFDAQDLRERRAETLRRVFAFLDVDPDFVSPSFSEEHNTASSHAVPNALGRRLGSLGERMARRQGLRRLVSREIEAPVPTPEQRERLVALLTPEVERLRAMTGLRLEHWEI
jgi:hypothetical protein